MHKEFFDLSVFNKYVPNEIHFIKYEPNLLLAALKVHDLMEVLGYARLSIHQHEVDYYRTELKGRDILLDGKKKSLMDALSYYNYAIDLSWQVLFLFSGSNNYKILLNLEEQDKYLRTCNFESLSYQLVLSKNRKLLSTIKTFFYNEKTVELRELYNYLKHRGTFDIIGINKIRINKFPLDFGDHFLERQNRKSFNLLELERNLYGFDFDFCRYLDCLLSVIFPKTFFEESLTVGDLNDFLERITEEYDILEEDVTKFNFIIPEDPTFFVKTRKESGTGEE